MLERTERYLDKAMCCHTLIIATLMHPCYWMDLFNIAFGSTSNEVTKCLKMLTNKFEKIKKNQDKQKPSDPNITLIEKPIEPKPDSGSIMDCLASLNQPQLLTWENEINTYLKAKIRLNKGGIDNKSSPLKWWKVKTTILAISSTLLFTP
jgi:hypothetical protein